ncbi:rod shape-determining protein RodA [Candidatus Azambacteria bacterium]|nr:rod shape-determining protein RodA [Candidatus Azambacteria bacterium]
MILIPQIKKMDWMLVGSALFLVLFGILEIFAINKNSPDMAVILSKQSAALVLGVFSMFAAAFFDYRFFKNNSYAAIIFYILSLAVLGVLLVIGSHIRGAAAWIKIGSFSIEPVEFVKIALIILFAKFFSQRHIEMHRFFHILVSGVYLALPLWLVLLQPDLGSAIVVSGIWVLMMLVSGMSKRHLLILMLIGALAASFAWFNLFKEYQKERIMTFLNPYEDPQGAGYNVIQSMIAVGDGGFFGKGLGHGSQVQFGFLPEAHTDFMFASIAEEFGFFGIIIIFTLLSVMVWRVVKIAALAENNFARLFCIGFASWIFVQVVINAGMNLGIMPVTGITFPFLSYGGSSLVALFIALGLVQSIKLRS